MKSCGFFGTTTMAEITPEFEDRLNAAFIWLLTEGDVSTFLTLNKTEFDHFCCEKLRHLKKEAEFIEIIKVKNISQLPPESNDYFYLMDMCDYVIIDSVKKDSITEEIYTTAISNYVVEKQMPKIIRIDKMKKKDSD